MLTINSPYIDATREMPPVKAGPLSNLNFSVKDVFDVKDHVTGLGNPTWQHTHFPAADNAFAIRRLLAQGASLNGITISDEFMFSIKGSNTHYGDPLNPKHPTCYAGGSSSGSASAVASGLVDFALGTDTGGSIRVPASYCGLYGFRPTHQMALLDGVAPLATSFDTVGLLANNPTILAQAGAALYSNNEILVPHQLYYLADPITNALSDNYVKNVQLIGQLLGLSSQQIKPLRLPSLFNLHQLHQTFKRIQGFEAWHNYGNWLKNHSANLGSDIKAHFQFAASIQNDYLLDGAYTLKNDFSIYLQDLLTNRALLVLPTTAGPAPEKNIDLETGEQIRAQTQQLTTIAGLAGVPQVALPVTINHQDDSLSLISGPETDVSLLKLIKKIGPFLNPSPIAK